jgi:hypothetical protein
MDMSDEGRDKVEEPELDMSEVHSPFEFLVVGMSEGESSNLLELRHSFPYKYRPCGPCFILLLETQLDSSQPLRHIINGRR